MRSAGGLCVLLRFEPDPLERPGTGDVVLKGCYYETLGGLHKREINLCGTFILRRISTIAVLNNAGNGQ